MKIHCCDSMTSRVAHQCDQHEDPFDCPDSLICYVDRFDEYGIIIHDGGSSYVLIHYCPWCGAKLPESKRVAWFSELEGLGLEPGSDNLPEKYQTDAW